MMAEYKKRIVEEKVDDFDGVSLYPSAMHRLYVLEGLPEVIENPSLEFLLEHLFEDEQTEPNEERFISGFFVEIDITEIGIQRHFPLINNGENYVNELCHMYVDHITLVDLLEFQKIKCKVLRGYMFTGKRDISVRKTIQNLFELRLKYKKENNPTQELIKLILNSMYGKTILKPIDKKIKLIPKEDSERYIYRNYNSIDKFEEIFNSKFVKVDEFKNINKHFNLVHFGVNILSAMKRIMNEVFCLAEDNLLHMYYQDMDSLHILHDDVPRLAEEFRVKYGRELIGKNLGQFHCDFVSLDGS
jgi:DNA polymerase elongation subunit (family B)